MKKIILVGLIIVSMLAVYSLAMATGQQYGVLTWNEAGTKAYGSSTGSPTVHQVGTTRTDPWSTATPTAPTNTASF